MAINSNGVTEDENPCRTSCSSKTPNLSSSRLFKINFNGKDSCSSGRTSKPNSIKDVKSPYFTNDKVQLLCTNRLNEKKRPMNKTPKEMFSSFPLAASVYKANSDEFKIKKKSTKKFKKSVLTLPNEQAPMPKTYTVSDLNDSECFNSANDSKSNKPKKRHSIKRYKKLRAKDHAMSYYNRDARYCSQLNIDLDCSSTESVNFTGDGQRVSKLTYKTNNLENSRNTHDMWALLSNIKKMQLIPSIPSQESVVPLRKRRPLIKNNNNRNDTHFIKTCHTEEISYISSFEMDSNNTRGSCSPSSSFDRITVIDKAHEQNEIIQKLSRNIFGSNLNCQNKIKSNQIQGKNKLRLKNCNKKVTYNKNKIENHALPGNDKLDKIPQLEGNIQKCHDIRVHSPDYETTSKTYDISKSIEIGHCLDIIRSNKEANVSDNDQINNFLKVERFSDNNKFNNVKLLPKGPNIINAMKSVGDTMNKGLDIVPSKLPEPERKPRLALTLPNATVHKLSQFEIKRRLAKLRYPIVILGKDEITNRGIYVPNVELPQFDGLDKHIWPFMLEWTKEKPSASNQDSQKKENNKSKNPKVKHKLNNHDGMIAKMDHREELSNYRVISKKTDDSRKKKNCGLLISSNPKQLVTEASSHVVPKAKPFGLFKNKMFQFLHKSPTTFSENDWSYTQNVESVQEKKQACNAVIMKNENSISKHCSPINISLMEMKDKPTDNRLVKKPYSSLRHPWGTGKWASDFIENIIKKIKRGVYYGAERREDHYRINGTEIATQTEVNTSKNAYCQKSIDIDFISKPTFEEDDTLENIPGFEKTLNKLEIETISTNKIAVKHCITNVVMQFDIQVLDEAKNVTNSKKSMSCIPINVKDNAEKVFKYHSSIINAILPAELCSIIPKMMQTILKVDNKLMPPAPLEIIHCERPQEIINSISTESATSDSIKILLNGNFSNSFSNKKIATSDFLITLKKMDSTVSYASVNTKLLCCFIQSSVILSLPGTFSNSCDNLNDKRIKSSSKSPNSCMALQLYQARNHSIVPAFGFLSILEFIKQIFDKINDEKAHKMITLTCNNFLNDIMINKTPLLSQEENNICLLLPQNGKVGVISLYNAFKKKINKDYKSTTIETNTEETEKPHNTSEESKTSMRTKQPIRVLRRKNYFRCYRKCNSMSSISSYKYTPLNRVTNLEEFCQVLGSNIYCSVLDGCLEKKILGALEEMKNWITEMSPKQALLILLLTNKKDTPNLIRFRPVLLQGIAVNRITKVDELDTEIEVIETENFHKISECEGISYLPASTKNQNSLLEELYWIAKTTASDYQKTFDESSEKLLKSLLQKRKKLNPSYLRVMARYVGLGLLAPTKL